MQKFNIKESLGGAVPMLLAPMAGVTDAAFREVCRGFGAVFTYSEMVSSKALVYQDAKSVGLLLRGGGEFPYAAQIFGSDPIVMADASVKVLELVSPEIIDINMGCPAPKIVRNGDGCALMRDPALAGRIIAAVAVAAGNRAAVTAKFRKGWDSGSVNAAEFARIMEANGADAVTIHGRVRSQLYSGTADWDIIREVKSAVSIPVIANGDVASRADASRCIAYTGADAVMVGRAAMGNPWVFSADTPRPGSAAELLQTALRQLKRAAELKGERTACMEARKHFSWYLKGVRDAGHYKQLAAQAVTLADFSAIVSSAHSQRTASYLA
ncbi:MAG: tRNA dihydrouridine synthase DusB [Oscillospiraceae bacterium]|nr:tRNA dihydrouridine synthase DusB [Oscillospiraceae bacterium]